MKKIVSLVFIVFILSITTHQSHASEYLNYQEITFKNFGGLMMREYTEDDFTRFYDRIEGRKFWGWKTTTVMDQEPITFQKETKYIITNEGRSPITKTYFFKTQQASTMQVSASGSIGVNTSGDIKGFKAGLDAELNIDTMFRTNDSEEEKVEIFMSVDPYTTLRVEVFGEGYITNGAAKYYRLFINVRSGGWEVFNLTTEYFSIVKERIDEIPDEQYR